MEFLHNNGVEPRNPSNQDLVRFIQDQLNRSGPIIQKSACSPNRAIARAAAPGRAVPPHNRTRLCEVIIAGCGIGRRAGRRPGKSSRSIMSCWNQAPRSKRSALAYSFQPQRRAVLQHLGVHEALSKVAFEPRDLLYRDWQSGQVLMRKLR